MSVGGREAQERCGGGPFLVHLLYSIRTHTKRTVQFKLAFLNRGLEISDRGPSGTDGTLQRYGHLASG